MVIIIVCSSSSVYQKDNHICLEVEAKDTVMFPFFLQTKGGFPLEEVQGKSYRRLEMQQNWPPPQPS